MYGQEGVKQALINYCTEKGVKYCKIAEVLGLHKSTISHFINDDRDMRRRNFIKLVLYLQQENYLK